MKVFKTEVSSNYVFELNEENYRTQIEGNEIYSSLSANNKELFAICPACNNPIKIVALYSEKRNPYAKHYPKNVYSLAKVDIASMKECKYFTGRRDIKEGKDRVPKGTLDKILCQTMRDYFDVAVSFFEQIIGVKVSFQFAEQLLREWIENEEWEYYCCTSSTLFFTCLYGLHEHVLYGRKIIAGSQIYKLLKKLPASKGLKFEKDKFNSNLVQVKKNDDVDFLKLSFNLDKYKRVVDNYGCVEYMELRVFCREKPKQKAEIFRQRIKIKSEEWDKLIKITQNSRNDKLLKLAHEVFSCMNLELDNAICQ